MHYYYIQGQESTSAQYLGVTIDEYLTWNNHVNRKANKVKSFMPLPSGHHMHKGMLKLSKDDQ